jgi:hypothetical protein
MQKEKEEGKVYHVKTNPIILTMSHSNNVRRKKYRKQASKIRGIGK